MTLQELYAQYGEYMVKKEILDGQINECKRAIANELNKGPVPNDKAE